MGEDVIGWMFLAMGAAGLVAGFVWITRISQLGEGESRWWFRDRKPRPAAEVFGAGIGRVGAVLGRWIVAAGAIGALWVVVTLAHGGRLHLTSFPCGSSDPDANLKLIGLLSAVVAAPIVAAWSAARARGGRRWAVWLLFLAASVVAALIVLMVVAVAPGCSGGASLAAL